MGVTNDKARDEAVMMSFREAGIANRYLNKEERLSNYGPTGELLAQWFASGKLRENFMAGRGVAIVGDGDKAVSLTQLCCRASLLLGLSTRLITLPRLRWAVCERDGEVLGELHRARVIGVLGFFDREAAKPFSEEVMFSIGWFFREMLMDNKAVVLHSGVPLAQTGPWWHSGLVDMLAAKTVDMEVKP